MRYTASIELRPIPPYDFDLSMRTFSGGDEQIRKYEHGKFWEALRFGKKLILVIIESMGSVDSPKLSAELRTDKELSTAECKKLHSFIYGLLHLGLGLKPFYEAVTDDPVLGILTQRLKGLVYPTTGSVYEAVIYAICEQQISLAVAHAIQARLIKKFGDYLRVDNRSYFTFPPPEHLAKADIEELRGCGLSYKKAEYIKNISSMVTLGQLDLEKFHSYKTSKDIIDELTKIKGVGLWTAEYVLVRGMTRLDAIPADDLGLRKAVSHYYCQNQKIGAEKVRDIAAQWGPWRGLACFYLLSARRLGIEI